MRELVREKDKAIDEVIALVRERYEAEMRVKGKPGFFIMLVLV